MIIKYTNTRNDRDPDSFRERKGSCQTQLLFAWIRSSWFLLSYKPEIDEFTP